MTLPSHQPDVAEAVRNLLTLRDLTGSFAESFGAIARRPEGVHLSPEHAQSSADALTTWVALMDRTVALLVPLPVADPAPAQPPLPPRRSKPRLAAVDGEVVP